MVDKGTELIESIVDKVLIVFLNKEPKPKRDGPLFTEADFKEFYGVKADIRRFCDKHGIEERDEEDV